MDKPHVSYGAFCWLFGLASDVERGAPGTRLRIAKAARLRV